MKLQFSKRNGSHLEFTRTVTLEADEQIHGPFVMEMVTVEGVRRARITDEAGTELWSGDLPDGPPPTRAFAVAAGMCDENGESKNLPLPEWAKR